MERDIEGIILFKLKIPKVFGNEFDIGGLKTCVSIKTMIKNALDKVGSRENSKFRIECF